MLLEGLWRGVAAVGGGGVAGVDLAAGMTATIANAASGAQDV